MRPSFQHKFRFLPFTASLLLIFLFAYASSSKLLDYPNFKIQMGQSPLLSPFADWLPAGVLLIEIVLCILLALPKGRLAGLYGSFTLLVLFTAYIYAVLHFSDYVPCSCGGILEQLGWREHLVFNLSFVLLTAGGVLAFPLATAGTLSKRAAALGLLMVLGTATIGGAIYLSDHLIHHDNAFFRSFPPSPAVLDYEMALGHNSYYFAGAGDGKVYLGNYTAPLLVTVVDSTLGRKEEHRITLDNNSLPFRALSISVDPPYFYVADGHVPCLFEGRISDWKASLTDAGGSLPYFSAWQQTGRQSAVLRTHDNVSGASRLTLFDRGGPVSVQHAPRLLERQLDGVFDTDGILLYSKILQKTAYVYFYRNEYVVADRQLSLEHRGKLIDTNTQAKIKIATLASGTHKLASPPATVNKNAFLCGPLLIVQSGLPAKNELLDVWETASVLDVYDLRSQTYRFSFYVYDSGGEKARSFIVEGSGLYVLTGHQLLRYGLGERFFR